MLARLPMLEIAIILIVGFALGYGAREWVSRRRRQAERQRRALGGAATLRVAIWQSTCMVAVSSVAGAKITNHRIPAHSERRALVFQRFLFPALQRGPFPEHGS